MFCFGYESYLSFRFSHVLFSLNGYNLAFKRYTLRHKLIALTIVKESSITTALQVLPISRTTLWRWRKDFVGEWMNKNLHRKKTPSYKVDLIKEILMQLLRDNPCSTQKDMQRHICTVHGIHVSIRTIFKALKKMRYSRKRVKTRGICKQDTSLWYTACFQRITSAVTEQHRIVSVDECGFSNWLCPIHGYSPIGQDIILKHHGTRTHWSLLLAVDNGGNVLGAHIRQGSITKGIFNDFILQLDLNSSALVLHDNASIHKNLQGSLPDMCYVPPYTPELNPIETVFHTIKTCVRKQAFIGDVPSLITHAIQSISQNHICNSFKHVFELCQNHVK